MNREQLSKDVHRAVLRQARRGKRIVSINEIMIACGSILVAYIGGITEPSVRQERLDEFIRMLRHQIADEAAKTDKQASQHLPGHA